MVLIPLMNRVAGLAGVVVVRSMVNGLWSIVLDIAARNFVHRNAETVASKQF